jgi:hypothetical protein
MSTSGLLPPDHSGSDSEPVAKSLEEVEHMEEPRFELAIVSPSDPQAEEARELERIAFYEFYGNSPEQLNAEYGPYEAASTFLIIRDSTNGRASGVIRLIHNTEARLKSLNDLEKEPWQRSVDEVLNGTNLDMNLDKTLDIATYVIAPGYRASDSAAGALTQMALFRGLCSYSVETGTDYLIGIVDDKVLARVQDLAGAPFHRYTSVESKPYLDSPASTPVWADMREFIPRLQRDSPALYGAYFEGEGLGFLRLAEVSSEQS